MLPCITCMCQTLPPVYIPCSVHNDCWRLTLDNSVSLRNKGGRCHIGTLQPDTWISVRLSFLFFCFLFLFTELTVNSHPGGNRVKDKMLCKHWRGWLLWLGTSALDIIIAPRLLSLIYQEISQSCNIWHSVNCRFWDLSCKLFYFERR